MAVTLSAVMIVRDEAAVLADCLASLNGVVDNIFVHDTGSIDETIDIAHRFGAHVSEGQWANDFAAARNAALGYSDSDWILSIDADETVIVDTKLWREFLVDVSFDVAQVSIEVDQGEAPYTFPAARLFRRETVKWTGAVHEQLVGRDGQDLEVATVPGDILRIVHSGYATAEQRESKARRNAELAATVDTGDAQAHARATVDLGRSLIATDKQAAADAFETVRSQYPNTPEWTEATDFLTRLLLAEEMYDETLGLTKELSEHGGRTDYCDWIAAQALVGLGNYGDAKALLNNVTEVVDTSGRVHSEAALKELKAIVNQLAG